MNKPLKQKSATLLGAGLSIFGLVFVFFTAIQLEDPIPTTLNMMGALVFGLGTWVSTVAKTMKDSTGEEKKELQIKT